MNERSVEKINDFIQEYLNSQNDLIEVSKELAEQLFKIMRSNSNIPSADLIITSITTEQGPLVAILKLDYVKNFTHEINVFDNKIGVGIKPQIAGLPGGGQKIQKAAFIKTFNFIFAGNRSSFAYKNCITFFIKIIFGGVSWK